MLGSTCLPACPSVVDVRHGPCSLGPYTMRSKEVDRAFPAQVWDVETGFDRELLNMNPEGWIQGVTDEKCATCHR